jgi:hypothetical protein
MLGLRVLKTLAHRELAEGTHKKSCPFVLVFGELLGDIFDLLHKTLMVILFSLNHIEALGLMVYILKLPFFFSRAAKAMMK